MRRLFRLLAARSTRHPHRALIAGALGGSLITLILVLSLGGFSSGNKAVEKEVAGSNSASHQPTFTYAGTWTLLELQRHIEAGEVIAITMVEEPADPNGFSNYASNGRTPLQNVPRLAAKTTDGQFVRIQLSVTTTDAIDALKALGYGRLLTNEALFDSGAFRQQGQVSQADSLSLLEMLVVPLFIAFSFGFWFWLTRYRRRAVNNVDSDNRRIGQVYRAEDHKAAKTAAKVKLADVAGCDEAKLELTETIEFLKNPDRFISLGAKIPRGVMLWGPPGNGKTLLARAVACEADVPFFYASGTDFMEKYVGVGASRIRLLFDQAKKAGKAVIFIDEIDAIGKVRGGPNSHEEREHTLNQLLVEMDGFATSDQVVVIAATNRIDTLDPALLRPGRFTRKVHVPMPDRVSRRAILEVHAAGKPLAKNVDLDKLASDTFGFSGAMLADLFNEAAIIAARSGHQEITLEDVRAGWLKAAVGTSRRRSMAPRERSIIAVHEAGHAICGYIHDKRRRVNEISLFAHGEALGVTISSAEDNSLPSESDLKAQLVALMGGRAAEVLLFQEVTGGASNDFEKANELAEQMVTRLGMGVDPETIDSGVSGRGLLSFFVRRDNADEPSAEVKEAQTRAIRHLLDEAYKTALSTLANEASRLRRVAAYLYERERMDGDEFEALMAGRLAPASETAWRDAAAHPRDWAEIESILSRADSLSSREAVKRAFRRQPMIAIRRQGRTSVRKTARRLFGALERRLSKRLKEKAPTP